MLYTVVKTCRKNLKYEMIFFRRKCPKHTHVFIYKNEEVVDDLGPIWFAFALKPQGGEEWNLSMSAVLSSDARTIWVMAWLDELPRSSRDVPRTALLKLLAENDLLGKGKFFSYIPSNRRFALQQVVENHSMTTRKFHGMLVELGHTVIDTYGFWSVEAWKEPAAGDSAGDPNAGQQTTSTNNNTVNQPTTTTTTAKPAAATSPSAGTGKPRTIATPASNKK